MARRTRTPKIKWLVNNVHVRRKIISRRAVWQPLFSLHYFHYDLCQSGSGIQVYLLPVIPTLSVSIYLLWNSYNYCRYTNKNTMWKKKIYKNTQKVHYEVHKNHIIKSNSDSQNSEIWPLWNFTLNSSLIRFILSRSGAITEFQSTVQAKLLLT